MEKNYIKKKIFSAKLFTSQDRIFWGINFNSTRFVVRLNRKQKSKNCEIFCESDDENGGKKCLDRKVRQQTRSEIMAIEYSEDN